MYNVKDPPFTFKLVHNFLEDTYYNYIKQLIQTKHFHESCQSINNKIMIQKEHKIRQDYVLNNNECSVIDIPLIKKADCNCNLRERWRLLYYNGDLDENSFRGPHTDWTNYSNHRLMSIVIAISNENDYEGGELCFKDYDLKLKLQERSAIIFDSKLVHEVLPVTRGKRYVLQAFLFNDYGYSIKTNRLQTPIHNYALLEDKSSTIIENNNHSYEDFSVLYNKNAVHSKVCKNDMKYNIYYNINSLEDVKEKINTLKKKYNDLYCYTWHTNTISNTKWKNSLIIWNKETASNKKRYDINTWVNENNVVSGLIFYTIQEFNELKELNELNEIQEMNITDTLHAKYVHIISCNGGPGNQIVGIKELIMIGLTLNKNILLPPIIDHYTRQKKELMYWNFNEIFNIHDLIQLKNIKLMDSSDEEYHNLIHSSKKLYFCRHSKNLNLRMFEVLNIDPNTMEHITLEKRSFRSINDYECIETIQNEDIIHLVDLYNNTQISNCFWNGCDLCDLNVNLSTLYKEVCQYFDFSDCIKKYGDTFIFDNFNNKPFVSLHLRYPDYINTTKIKDINTLYDENTLYEEIVNICTKNNIPIENVFIATSNQNEIKKTNLIQCKVLETNTMYNRLESFIEQYICCMSNIFVYSGGIHAKPDHTHLRSTWSSFVIDYRSYKLNKENTTNIYLQKYFENIYINI